MDTDDNYESKVKLHNDKGCCPRYSEERSRAR